MTKSTKKVLTAACALAPFACLLSILLPVFKSAHVAEVRSTCFSNVRTLAAASLQYASQFDEKLPKADGWMDQITPFVPPEKVAKAFHCPELDPSQYGYATNSAIAGKPVKKVVDPSTTYLIFETETLGRNVYEPPTSILATPRHGTIARSFVDGHAKNSRPK